MRITLILALAAAVTAPLAAQQSEDLSREERARLEARLDRLRDELRELERRLGRSNVSLFSEDGEPFVWSVVTANRARLGVIVATGENETDSQGARLQAVTPNGPADEAGLRAGDIITRVNGQSLANARPSPGEALIEAVDDLDDGDTVRVDYRRGTTNASAAIVARAGDMTFGVRSPNFNLRLDPLEMRTRMRTVDPGEILDRALVEVREMPGLHSTFFTSGWSSMELVTLDADLGSYFGTTEGVLVIRAPSDSLLGLRSGDVIRRIGGRVPSSPSHAVRILRSYEPGDEIRIEITRQRRQQTLAATVPEQEAAGAVWRRRN